MLNKFAIFQNFMLRRFLLKSQERNINAFWFFQKHIDLLEFKISELNNQVHFLQVPTYYYKTLLEDRRGVTKFSMC